MKTNDQLLAMQLEVAEIEFALDNNPDLALCLQNYLARRELLLKEAIDIMTEEQRPPCHLN